MSRYIAVVHSWFVYSKGFETKTLEAKSDRLASIEAKAFASDLRREFADTAVIVIKVGKEEVVLTPRRLSWKERLTGWLGLPEEVQR